MCFKFQMSTFKIKYRHVNMCTHEQCVQFWVKYNTVIFTGSVQFPVGFMHFTCV